MVHTRLDVIGDMEHRAAVFRRYHPTQSPLQPVIVNHQEYYIKNHHYPVENTEHEADAVGYQPPCRTESAFDNGNPLVLGYHARKTVKVDIPADKRMYLLWQIGYVEFAAGVILQQMSHLPKFRDYIRDSKSTRYRDDKQRLKQCHKNRNDAPTQMQETAVELNERLQYISYKTCHAKRQQHCFKIIDKIYRHRQQGNGKQYPYHSVKRVGA